jgi:hypothetical protein
MNQAVLYVNELGKPSINAAVIMENAIELVFSTVDPKDIDSLTIPARIESAHTSLLGIAAKLLANGMTGNLLRTIPQTPVVEPEVVVALTPTQVEPPAPVAARQVSPPTSAQPTAIIIELPLERPVQPRSAPLARAKPQARRNAPVALKPVQELFPLDVVVVPAKAKVKAKAKVALKRRRSDVVAPPKEKLPRRLSNKEDALKMDTIVCLEDGQKVVDLGKHLETLGITPEEYQRKWGLSDSYPMRAPTFIQKRGIEYEYDPVHKRMVKMS